jgi:hypothetical protein
VVPVVLLVLVELDGVLLLLRLVSVVGRAGKILVGTVVPPVVGKAVVRPLLVVVVGAGTGTGTGPGGSSAGTGRLGVWKGAGSAACRFRHKGLLP